MPSINDEEGLERPLIDGSKLPVDDSIEDNAPPRRRWFHHITVQPVVLLYFMYFTPIIMLTQQFIYARLAKDNGFTPPKNGENNCNLNTSSDEYKLEQHIQVLASRWQILLTTAGVIPATFSTIFLGSYSDNAGRKPVLLLPFFGGTVRSIVSLVVANYELHLGYLFIGVVIEGLSGSICAEIMACFAYIADVTTHKQRALGILILELSLAVGVFLASVGMGYLIHYLGFTWPFLFGICIHLINSIYVVLFVKETIKPKPDVRILDWDNFFRIGRLISFDLDKRRWRLLMGLVILGLACMVELGNIDINTLYMLDSPLCFNSVNLGYFSAISFAARNFGALFAVLLLIKRLGITGLMLAGCISLSFYQLMFSIARTKLYIFLAVVPGLGSTLAIPMVRAYGSKLVRAEEQGTLFAAIAGIQLICALLGTVMFTSLYSVTVTSVHSCTYYVTAGIALIAAALSLWLMVRDRREQNRLGRQLQDPVMVSAETT